MTAPVGKSTSTTITTQTSGKRVKTTIHVKIVLEKTTREKAQDRSLPTDAFNVVYIVDGKEHLDVTRSEKMVNGF